MQQTNNENVQRHPFSSDYVKMAVAAKELQRLHPENQYEIGDYVFTKPNTGPDQIFKVIILEDSSMENWLSPSWVPSIEQLKKLLGNNLIVHRESQGTPDNWRTYDPAVFPGYAALLGHYMNLTYSKTWDGENWIENPK